MNAYQLELSKEQFHTLLKAVYLGNWLANGHRTEDRLSEYYDLESYVFSKAKEWGFPELVDDSDPDLGIFPSVFMEQGEVNQLIDEADEETFFQELIEIMTNNEIRRRYSEDEYRGLSQKEHLRVMCQIESEIVEELNEKGLENLSL